eukprot:5460452-Pyramimonas_sp.AAC.1
MLLGLQRAWLALHVAVSTTQNTSHVAITVDQTYHAFATNADQPLVEYGKQVVKADSIVTEDNGLRRARVRAKGFRGGQPQPVPADSRRLTDCNSYTRWSRAQKLNSITSSLKARKRSWMIFPVLHGLFEMRRRQLLMFFNTVHKTLANVNNVFTI